MFCLTSVLRRWAAGTAILPCIESRRGGGIMEMVSNGRSMSTTAALLCTMPLCWHELMIMLDTHTERENVCVVFSRCRIGCMLVNVCMAPLFWFALPLSKTALFLKPYNTRVFPKCSAKPDPLTTRCMVLKSFPTCESTWPLRAPFSTLPSGVWPVERAMMIASHPNSQ